MIEVVQAFDRAPITRLESDDAAALDRKIETAKGSSQTGMHGRRLLSMLAVTALHRARRSKWEGAS